MGSLLAIILAINDLNNLVAGTALLNGLWLHENKLALSKDTSTISWQI